MDDDIPRASVPADIGAPDTIAWGLPFRQLAIIGSVAGRHRERGRPLPAAGARPEGRARRPYHHEEDPMSLFTHTRTRSRTSANASADPVPAPSALEISPSHVRIGDGYAATYAVCGYPAEVGPAWLVPLLSYPGRVTVAVHTEPVPVPIAAPMLTKQRARLESTRRIDAERGKLGDPTVEAAATDAADLAERVARGASKLHHGGIYVTVHGRNLDELHDTAAGVRSAAASMLLDLQPATFRHHLGYTTTLPLGVDNLGMRRIFDTESLAAAFPFASGDLAAPAPGQHACADAVLYGVNTTSHGVVMWNRWAQDNHNSVVLARSGAGRSYFVKLEVLRNLYQGVEVAVIDPEDEYTSLAEHVGGTVIQLGAPGVRLNPLDQIRARLSRSEMARQGPPRLRDRRPVRWSEYDWQDGQARSTVARCALARSWSLSGTYVP